MLTSTFRFTKPLIALSLFGACICLPAPTVSGDDSLTDALKAVCAVAVHGEGHESAVEAMSALNKATINQVPEILKAMDDANKVSQNWLRSAVVSAVARGGELPREEIKSVLDDRARNSMGRLLAFELLTDGNEELASEMIPGFIDDPSLPLRYKAVDALINSADAISQDDSQAVIGFLGLAMKHARDVKQIQAIAHKFSNHGVMVNLQAQLGFLPNWHIVGSFDNKDMGGFNVAHGPEQAIGMIDLNATYKDQDGNDTTWNEVSTINPIGNVNLNEQIGKVKGATVYAMTNFKSLEACNAEIRIGTANATKIWLNGELVMVNEIYHNSNSIDKFKGTVKLKEGDNQIFMKVCQNEQKESWAQDWQFQFRICDASGKPTAQAAPPAAQY